MAEVKQNGARVGILVLIGGIPIALVLGVIFGAGSMKAQVDSFAECSRRLEESNAKHEFRLTKLETYYERTCDDVKRILIILEKQPH